MQKLLKKCRQAIIRWSSPGSQVLYGINYVIMIYTFVMIIVATGLVVTMLMPVRVDGQGLSNDRAHYGGTINDLRIDELDQRLKTIEGLKIDSRLAVIESIVRETNSNSFWGPMSMGGIGLLALREALKTFRGRERSYREEDDDE